MKRVLAPIIVVALTVAVTTLAGLHLQGAFDSPAKTPAPAVHRPGYVATPKRTQLYRSGSRGDAILYRVVDMPSEGLRCVMLVSTSVYGRAVSCTPLRDVTP